ncbi:MAG: hypothetical protein HY952_12140 [Elusimicrobia bacterium]|nr:hypothetical protein [Elusimicrobiota bacterium]
MTARSKEFGLLLDHIFRNEGGAMSATGAARLSGLPVRAALSVMEILETEGILRGQGGRRRRFRANAGDRAYRRCRLAYLVRS